MNSARVWPLARQWVLGCWIGAIAFLLSSCPVPFDIAILNRVKDDTGPAITVLSPDDGSSCANIVQVDGTVTDSATPAGDDGEVSTLSYEVLGTTVTGNVTMETDGSFTFQFTTVTFGDTFTLALTATDWMGNATTESLTLYRQAGSGLPSFTAVPGNKAVLLEWDLVPNTASYTLRYTTNGALPSDTVGIELPVVDTGLELTGLENGNLHVFQLFAVPVDVPDDPWPESVSGFVRAVPLSEQTLAPRATGEVRGILVEWDSIPATDEFEVWRSTQLDGEYSNLSGPIVGASYTDTDASDGAWYFYKVKPAGYENPLSAAAGAQTEALNLHDPYVVTTVDTPEMAYKVTIDGSYAYVADRNSGLQVIDISVPEKPVLVGSCDTEGSAWQVAVSGGYAYIADGGNGLVVVNVSDPANPTVVDAATRTTPYYAIGIAVDSSYAYVADQTSVRVFDVADPTNPIEQAGAGVAATPAFNLTVDGAYLYVTCFPDPGPSATVQIYSLVADRSDPIFSGSCDTPGQPWGIQIDGGYAFVGATAAGLQIIDVSLPDAPEVVGACDTPGDAYDVVVDGRYAFMADRTAGMQIIDISYPPGVTDASNVGFCSTPGDGLGIARSGSYVYVADWEAGLTVVKAAFPMASPQIIGSVSSAGQAQGVAVRGSYAYVGGGAAGFLTVDISNHLGPSVVGTYSIPDYSVLSVQISGDHAYAAVTKAGGDGLQIIDISDPTGPTAAGFTPIAGGALNATIRGAYAFTTNDTIGMHLVDISDPYGPGIVGLLNTNGITKDVAVQGSYAYVADGPMTSGFVVADISDPTTPFQTDEINWVEDPGTVSVGVSGNYAYVIHAQILSGGTLQVVDVSDPYNLFAPPAAVIALSDEARAVTVHGSYVFVADGTDGLRVIDVWDPENPVLVSTCPLPNATEVAVSGRYAYVTTSDGFLKIIDLLPDL